MRAGLAVLAVLVAIALTGCEQDNIPTEYNSLTNQNFVELCTNHLYDLTDDTTLTETGNTIAPNVDAPDPTVCQCQYEVFVVQMPINKNDTSLPNYTGPNFTDLNAQLKTDPEAAWATVSDSIKDAVSSCDSASGTGLTTSTVAPTTTPATTPPN